MLLSSLQELLGREQREKSPWKEWGGGLQTIGPDIVGTSGRRLEL